MSPLQRRAMDLEVVTVGTELLLGFTLNSNAADIGKCLAPFGFRIVRSTSVGDDEDSIREVVSEALSRSGLVVVTGGLGPTRDDITKKTVAEIFNAPLELDTAYLEKLKSWYERFGRGPLPESNRCQAEIPKGADVLTNPRGTAPGLWLEGDPGVAVLLPGVPIEMRLLMEREVIPRLRAFSSNSTDRENVVLSKTLRTTGVSESHLATLIEPRQNELTAQSLAYLPGVDGVDLRLTVWNSDSEEARIILKRDAGILRSVVGGSLYGEDGESLAENLLTSLKNAEIRLAVAESCTGGLIGARLTEVAGASDVFAGGIICYENASKKRDLGVSEDLLVEYGAVSEPVARAMVLGVAERFAVDGAIAVTGIAGPGGGSEDKPVGTVWIAALANGEIEVQRRWFAGERDEVRQRTAQAGLDLLRCLLR